VFVGVNTTPSANAARRIAHDLRRIGFKLRVRLVSPATMLVRYCGLPEAAIAICPSVGWAKDFFDAESFLDPLFNGANIERFLNANYAQVDDPEINRTLELANALSDPAERARLYGQVDRQVTDRAYVIPWLWETSIPLRAAGVHGVASRFTAGWDLTFTAVQ
jgi:peptide/nickel transport system substrate-binding protein